jgi:serine phosphatase RsbU (regulator of sigma subunit)
MDKNRIFIYIPVKSQLFFSVEKTTFTFLPRLQRMQSDITGDAIKPPRLSFYATGWLITFFFFVFAVEIGSFTWIQIWVLMHGIFWYQLNRYILSNISILPELLILALLLLCGLQSLYWDSLYDNFIRGIPADGHLGFLPGLISAFISLLFGFLLISNFKDEKESKPSPERHAVNQGVLIPFLLIGIAGHYLVFFEHRYYLFLFQLILLLFLLNYTTWLERLSRRESWIYFWILLVIFYFFQEPKGYHEIKLLSAQQKLTWLSLPLYLYLSVKMYVLALLIRIPIVIIYNHARLSGKLRIAGLFQSTLPQIFQFIFLIIIFYFFISSWQAQEMRRIVNVLFEEPAQLSPSITVHKILKSGHNTHLKLEGYKSFKMDENLPSNGIIRLNTMAGQPEFFLYSRKNSYLETISFIHIDTLFCNSLAKNLPLLAGNGIIMYPFTPKTWQAFFYERDFLEDKSQAKIYPFDITTNINEWVMGSSINEPRDTKSRIVVFGRDVSTYRQKFIVGRLLYPIVIDNTTAQDLFAFDIFLSLQTSFFSSTMSHIVLYLIILYFLFNLFIIRRVGKFGEQINKIIIQKFEQLKAGIGEISSGNLEYKLRMEGEDEFVELANHFNRMGGQLKQKINEAREKERLDHELQIARQVQLSLLPAKLPRVEGYEISASMKTANEVGGDFYDLIPLDKNRYLFTVGDVSGKGSSAAFYMAQFISLLRFSPQFTAEPLELTRRLNDYFSTQLADRQVFVTAIVGILNADKNKIEYVRAGHNFPILLPGNAQQKIQEIDTRGIGIGLTKSDEMFRDKIEIKRMTLHAGDILLLFTDGVVEAAIDTGANQKAEVFGEKRFRSLLQTARQKSGKTLVKLINNELDLFYGDNPRIDDHTLFVINRLNKT